MIQSHVVFDLLYLAGVFRRPQTQTLRVEVESFRGRRQPTHKMLSEQQQKGTTLKKNMKYIWDMPQRQ